MLKISSDDTYILLGQLKNSKKSTVNISLNYYSKIPHRYYILDFEKKTIHADFINNNIFIKYLNGKTFKKSFKNFSRNFSYIKMHEAVINKRFQNLLIGLEKTPSGGFNKNSFNRLKLKPKDPEEIYVSEFFVTISRITDEG